MARYSLCMVVSAMLSASAASHGEGRAAGGGNLIPNGDFSAGLAGWEAAAANGEIGVQRTCDAWNTYSLSFNSKGNTRVYFYISVSPDPRTGGTLWIDNVRMNGASITNPSFEDTHVNGLAPGWEHEFRMYNQTKRHAKLSLGTDFQQASDGLLSMRLFAPPQTNLWKLRVQPAPEGVTKGWKPPDPTMSRWRPLFEGEILIWQVIEVKPETDYTILMDYRMSRDFAGTIRPAVGSSMQNWHLLAHAGWSWTEFKEMQKLRDQFGRSLAMMKVKDGTAALSREIDVEPNRTLHLSVDLSTSRRHTGKPLQMTARLVCEDATTGKPIGEDRFVWDGAPGHGEGLVENGSRVEGDSGELRLSFVTPSEKIRVRVIAEGRGEAGTLLVGQVQLSGTPRLIPPVQRIACKDAAENFRVADKLTYAVAPGDAADIEGALWLTAHDLKERGLEFVADRTAPKLSIGIGTFGDRGDQGYRLAVSWDTIRVDAASPRAAQYALMTLLQLVGADVEGPFITGVDVTDWPDMPLRGVVMEGCSHFTPRAEKPVRLTDLLYHDNERQTWARSDLLQLARWKFNTVWWRSTGTSRRLLDEAKRFHVDSMGFISTISDPPSHGVFVEHPEWIEGVHVENEKVTLQGLTPAKIAKPNVIRDELTDVAVTSVDKKTTYRLGRDVGVSGQMGTYNPSAKKMEGGKPFAIARLEGSRIADGQSVLVSYDYIDKGERYSWHTQYCLGKPEAVEYVGNAAKEGAATWKFEYVNIRGDELTHVNSDSRSKRLGLSSTELLLDHLKFIRDKVHEGSPDTRVCMWHDAFSPYAGGYAWGFTEDGPAPPPDVWQLVWYYGPGTPTDLGWVSLKHSHRHGLTSIGLPWFDLRAIREWAQVIGEARRRGFKCLGMMDTPWGYPNPYPNFRETAIVSWRVPREGEPGWVPFSPENDDQP